MTATALQKLEALERFKRNPPKHKLVVPAVLTPKRKAYLKATRAIDFDVGFTGNFAISYLLNDWQGLLSEKSLFGTNSRRRNTSEEVARYLCALWLHKINVFFFAKDYQKRGLYVKRMAVLEKISHWHYHIAIQIPKNSVTEWGKSVAAERVSFETFLIDKWNGLAGPTERAFVSAGKADDGWNTYITKFNNDICVENTRF